MSLYTLFIYHATAIVNRSHCVCSLLVAPQAGAYAHE